MKNGDKVELVDDEKSGEDESDSEEAGFPMISMDYCFMGTHSSPVRKVPILIARDEKSRWIMGYAVDKKGPVPWLVSAIIEDIKNLGYGSSKIVLKSDQEDAIVALRNAIIERRKAETVPKLSVKRDPKSHGEIEVAVKTWAGQFRTLKCHIEGETGKFLPMTCDATTWLVRWAANSLNMYRIQAHGCTAHEAIGGRKCKTPICPFGECIQWKVQRGGVNSTKAVSEWFDGIFLGVRAISGECIVGTPTGIFYCRTVRRVADDSMWSMKAITTVNGTAHEVSGDRHGGAAPGKMVAHSNWDMNDKPDGGKSGDKHVEAEIKPDIVSGAQVPEAEMFDISSEVMGDEDAAYELFGPDDDDELQDAPVQKSGNDNEHTSMGSQVVHTGSDAAAENHEVEISAPVAVYSPPTRPIRRRRIDSDDEDMADNTGSPSTEPANKRGRAQDDSDDDSEGMLNHITENRKILSALIRGVDITEIYSPERVTQACRKQNLVPGSSLDLTTGWDFSLKDHRDKAFNVIRHEKPKLLIGSPPCTYFYILQNLNLEIRDDAWKKKFHQALEVAKGHIRYPSYHHQSCQVLCLWNP